MANQQNTQFPSHLTTSEYSMLREFFIGEVPANPSMSTNVPSQVVPEKRKIRGEEIEEAEAEFFASSKMKGVTEKQTHSGENLFEKRSGESEHNAPVTQDATQPKDPKGNASTTKLDEKGSYFSLPQELKDKIHEYVCVDEDGVIDIMGPELVNFKKALNVKARQDVLQKICTKQQSILAAHTQFQATCHTLEDIQMAWVMVEELRRGWFGVPGADRRGQDDETRALQDKVAECTRIDPKRVPWVFSPAVDRSVTFDLKGIRADAVNVDRFVERLKTSNFYPGQVILKFRCLLQNPDDDALTARPLASISQNQLEGYMIFRREGKIYSFRGAQFQLEPQEQLIRF